MKRRVTLSVVIAAFAAVAIGLASSASGSGATTSAPAPPFPATPPPPLPSSVRPQIPSSDGVPPVTSPLPGANEPRLDAAARAFAGYYGEADPRDIQTLLGVEQGTLPQALLGGPVPTDRATRTVDVVQEQGNFTLPSVPMGASPASGHVLTVVVDRSTGLVSEVALAESYGPDQSLANLDEGSVVALP
jgi:hypothetical protein